MNREVKFRLGVNNKTDAHDGMQKVTYYASPQENFGKYTPSVNFEAVMVKDAADMFEIGKEYYFTAVPVEG